MYSPEESNHVLMMMMITMLSLLSKLDLVPFPFVRNSLFHDSPAEFKDLVSMYSSLFVFLWLASGNKERLPSSS